MKEVCQEGTKRCKKCGEIKLLTDFHKTSDGSRYGVKSRCKVCLARRKRQMEVLPEGLKRCSKCKEVKGLDGFYKSRSNRPNSWCKKCEYEGNRARVLANPEKARHRNTAWDRANRERRVERRRQRRAKNPEKYRQYQRAWNAANPDKARAKQLKKYGITIKELDRIISLQDGECKCCGVKLTKTGKYGICVDHCHSVGHVRGIICNRCNRVEGMLGTLKVARALVCYMEDNELLSYQGGVN